VAGREHRRVANQGGTLVPDADRVFAEAVRRLLLKVVAMIEDRYGLRPINAERQSVTTR
jgi:hypothetical protein